jgi:uncharacterized membrane protein
MDMDLVGAMIAGLAGTVAMSLLIYIGPFAGMPRMDLIDLLGSMFSGNRTAAFVLGILLHLAIGALSGIVYGTLWSLGIIPPTWATGLLFGLGHWVVVSLMIPRILMMHPRNPTLERSMVWVFGFLLAHLVFGIVTALVYAPFVS